jgi:hypothetical protein
MNGSRKRGNNGFFGMAQTIETIIVSRYCMQATNPPFQDNARSLMARRHCIGFSWKNLVVRDIPNPEAS